MRLSDHELDPGRLSGIWWDYETGQQCDGNAPHAQHGCFLVVPAIASRYWTVMQDLQRPHLEARRQAFQSDDPALRHASELVHAQLHAQAIAETILLDWRNIEKADGSPWPYSKHDAAALFAERKWLAVANQIAVWSGANDAALAREEEEAKGN